MIHHVFANRANSGDWAVGARHPAAPWRPRRALEQDGLDELEPRLYELTSQPPPHGFLATARAANAAVARDVLALASARVAD